MKKAIAIILGVGLLLPVLVFAKIGVGVGTGKIQMDQPLKPGLIYTLPSLVVINTGDEPAEYGVGIQHREKQPEKIPSKEWFSFEPLNFHLEPGQSRIVQIKLTLPVKGVEPGDYFAFLQGFPIQKIETGQASVGVAAAAKLYFTVAPSNIFVGIYYRTLSLLTLYSPWSYVILAIIIAALVVVLFRKFFSFNIGLSRKTK